MKKNKLIQFSTTWCGPCKTAKKKIEEYYNPTKDTYEFVNVENTGFPYADIASLIGIKSVPTFVIYNEEKREIIKTFRGFSMSDIADFFTANEEEE